MMRRCGRRLEVGNRLDDLSGVRRQPSVRVRLVVVVPPCKCYLWSYCIHLIKSRSHNGIGLAEHSDRPSSKTATLRNGILKSSLSKIRTWGN